MKLIQKTGFKPSYLARVSVIGSDGKQLGVLLLDQALSQANLEGLDLVEVNGKITPPVCKIMDYGKFKYEDAKKKKESKKNQTVVVMKEVKFRPKTDEHDFNFKLKNIRGFLEKGNKVKIVVVFKGRENLHKEIGEELVAKIVTSVADLSVVDKPSTLEGKALFAIINPK